MPDATSPEGGIPNDAKIWRRVPPRHFYKDEKRGGLIRPATSAFEDDPDGSPMSAAQESLCGSPDPVMRGHEGYGLVEFTAGYLRTLGLEVVPDPTDAEPWHVLIAGNKTNGVRKKLARNSKWIVPPPQQPPATTPTPPNPSTHS
jgi:hypothetical protein